MFENLKERFVKFITSRQVFLCGALVIFACVIVCELFVLQIVILICKLQEIWTLEDQVGRYYIVIAQSG